MLKFHCNKNKNIESISKYLVAEVENVKEISEQFISNLAPNSTAVNNAKKISAKGGFVKLSRSADDTFYMGQCKGSGKSDYITSADFVDETNPVFRCSCPSRQFPCKHSLALLFEMAAKKDFEVCEIPQDILDKRKKKETREAKKQEKEEAIKDGTAAEKDAASAKAAAKKSKAAKTKKIKKQLEGLKLTEDMIRSLLQAGLGTIGGNSVKAYTELAKQLGDYYLSGPQNYIQQLIAEIEAFKKDGDESHYREAGNILVKLRALVKKSEAYLNAKLESDDPNGDDNILYEELGGIWKLDELNTLGLKKESAALIQLSFEVIYNEARKEYVDTGWWADIESGEVFATYNYRPANRLKYMKEEDTIFETACIPILSYYPGELNRRIRWEEKSLSFHQIEEKEFASLREHAEKNLPDTLKKVKNQIKNTLSDSYVVLLFAYQKIGRIGETLVMEDAAGNRITFADMKLWNHEGTIDRFCLLSEKELFQNQVLLGAFFYDEEKRRICVQPYSIVTQDRIIRLLY